MKIFALLLNTSRLAFFITCICSAVAGISCTYTIKLINTLLSTPESNLQNMLIPFCISTCCFAFSALLAEYLMLKFSTSISHELRTRISSKILNSDLVHIQRLQPHKLLAILTDDCLTLTNTIAELPTLLINFPIVIGCFIYIATLSSNLFLALILFIACIFFLYKLPIGRAKTHLRNSRIITNDLFKYVENMIFGLKELLQNNDKKQFFFKHKLTHTSLALKEKTIKYRFIYRSIMKIIDILVFIGIGLLLFAGPQFLSTPTASITPFILVLIFMLSPMNHCLNFISKYSQAQVALSHIQNVDLEIKNTQKQQKLTTCTNSSAPLLNLQNVQYRYNSTKSFQLGPINLEIPQNKIIFITGGNGSGKTTLLHLLTGLYQPTSGTLSYGTTVVSPETMQAYRSKFGVIFSDFYLFEQSYTHLSLQDTQRIQSYLKTFQLDHVVTFENNAFSTINVSQGQRKRLALIMELCLDKDIYVFDEWAADQDPEFKAYFYNTLLSDLKKQGKTIIAITHDDHYFHCCDHIIALQQGTLNHHSQRDLSGNFLAKNLAKNPQASLRR